MKPVKPAPTLTPTTISRPMVADLLADEGTSVISDPRTSIVITHPASWQGVAMISWEAVEPRKRHPSDHFRIGAKVVHECSCSAHDLVAGHLSAVEGDEMPVNVITRVVALAVADYVRRRMERALLEAAQIKAVHP